MAVTPYRASTDFFRPLFEDLFVPAGDGGRLGNMMRAPVADVMENETEIRVVLEMPGIRSEDLSVDIETNVLTIAGEKQQERKEGDDRSTWHLTERRYGHFSRSFVLPRDVDAENIQARFDNGVLTVTIPKSARARRRRIDVQADANRQQQVNTDRSESQKH